MAEITETAAKDALGQDEVATFLEDLALLAIRNMAVRDISFTTASTLSRLDRLGPARLTTLATAESVAQPSMTQLVQRLERQGLVARVGDPDDGRVVLVSITDAGRSLMERRRDNRVAWLAGLVGTLPPADRQALAEAARIGLPALRRLKENAARSSGPDAPDA